MFVFVMEVLWKYNYYVECKKKTEYFITGLVFWKVLALENPARFATAPPYLPASD